MPSPFYNAIKGTTAGTPGTGAFTPNAASSGFRAWSTVPTGWIGLVRYEDSSAWELSYSYWNGTTLSRSTNQRYDSSTGSALSLTSSSTAAMVVDGSEVQSDLAGTPWRGYIGLVNSTTTPTALGLAACTVTGTAAASALATTNLLTFQPRAQSNSATTANAQAGYSAPARVAVTSSTSGIGGFEMTCRFGAIQLPTGPRLWCGLSGTAFVGTTAEPSAATAHYAGFAKDSTDTNIQLLTNSNAGAGTKIDTGIAWAANGWYEATLMSEPGSTTIYGLLIRIDTGEIYYGSTSTDIPATGQTLLMELVAGLNGTNTGTALQLCMGQLGISGGC